MQWYLAAACGAGGAIIPDVLRLINDRFGPPPSWLLRWHYWLGSGLLIALGAVVAFFGHPSRPLDAAALGYSAPAIVAGLFGRKDGGPKEADINIGGTIKNISPTGLSSPRLPVPEFVRGIRAAWARR